MPDLLVEQWPFFVELAEAFGFVNLAAPGFEADDIIATLARQADAEGRELVIVTGDRDALQLVTEHVSVMSNTRGITEVKMYDPAAVVERFGVVPRLIPDLIGLKGDTSDNIPGVPGIGEKTAAQLLAEFGSLEEVLAGVDRVKGPKRQELLREHAETARLSKRLAILDHDAPIEIHKAEVTPHQVDRERLRELFGRFEFASLLDRLVEVLPTEDDLVSGPAPAEATELQVRDLDLRGLEAAMDWSLPVGLAARTSEGRDQVWLAQAPAGRGRPGGNAAEEGTPSVYALSDLSSEGGPLRELLRRGPRYCHDLKRATVLAGLLDSADHDTYLAAYLLAPGRRSYDLLELAAQAGLQAVRAEGPHAGAAEAATVLALAPSQERLLRELGMWRLFEEIELPLTRVLIDMEAVGIHLDCYRLGEITAKIQDQMDGLEAGIYELAEGEFNLGSPQQLGQVLFERLGLPRQQKTKTGHYSTDAKTLEVLRASHPIIERIEIYRELSKLLSTYLLALPAAVDAATGRLHTTFHQAVAATGRLSSSDPNLQNIPVRTALGAQIRECFTAEEGNLLVVADYSQIELRIMADLSQEPTLLDAFRNGEDIHTHTAAEVFDVPEDEVDSTHRRYAKAVNFGIMYGISAFGLAQQLGIDREQAGAYIHRYFERMPQVRGFIDATVADARTHGFVATVFGRRRPIPELRSSDFQTRSLGERLAVNSVIQGSAADIIKVAMVRCHRRLAAEYPRARLVLQVHDELLFEVPAGLADAVRAAMVEEMVTAFPIDPPLVVDAGIGPDWLTAK
jgi:DNA polymerase-1